MSLPKNFGKPKGCICDSKYNGFHTWECIDHMRGKKTIMLPFTKNHILLPTFLLLNLVIVPVLINISILFGVLYLFTGLLFGGVLAIEVGWDLFNPIFDLIPIKFRFKK